MIPRPGPDRPRALVRAGLGVLALGVAPLLAYTAFGPADGNPIGLGLLFAASLPVALGLILAGSVASVWGRRRGEAPAKAGPARARIPEDPGNGGRGHWP